MSWQIQVRGEWAGYVGGWRPAIDGTLNQTGLSAEEASTYPTREAAQADLEMAVLPECDSPDDEVDPRFNAPQFRIVEVE